MKYVYNDEDNVPMDDRMFDPIDQDGHNPTVYLSHAEMKAEEKGEIPFSEPPKDGCWNCREYTGDYCMKYWNNADEDYKDVDRDSKEPTDWCEDFDRDPDIAWEDVFVEEEP
jgi:hypothetical protein